MQYGRLLDLKGPTVFALDVFTRTRKVVMPSPYIKTAHPKTEIQVDAAAFRRILEAGWWGQVKIHGHRAQIHLPAEPKADCLVYNRHGRLHAKHLEPEIISEFRRIFSLEKSWTVLEAEWLKDENKLFLFDCIKLDGRNLSTLSYEKRYELLPKLYLSPFLTTLPVLRTVEDCMAVLKDTAPHIEGLIFKSRHSIGFPNHSMIRCRKN